MNRQALEQVVEQHVLKIRKHCDQVPGSFAVEEIHDLRVEYKKLRAFLRLLQLERDADNLQMPDQLKTVYRSAGAVRDLQLFIAALPAVPVFMQIKQRQLFACKESLVRAIEDLQFKKALRSIGRELPRELHDDTHQKFIQRKIATIHIILLTAEEENDLHDTRKNVKDIIYHSKQWQEGEEPLSDVATQSGLFNDRCIALTLIQDHDNIPQEEMALLDELQLEWEKEKEALQAQLLQQLRQLI